LRATPDETQLQVSEAQGVPDGEASEPNVPSDDVVATSAVEPVDPAVDPQNDPTIDPQNDPTIDPQKNASWRDAFREAISSRDLVAAHDMLEEARQPRAVFLRPAEVRMAERLVDSLDRFWEAVKQVLLTVSSGDVILYGKEKEKVTIISIEPNQLTWTAGQGAPRSSALDAFQMDPDLAVRLAYPQLSSLGPDLWLDVGVFLAIDDQGDRSLGIQYVRGGRPDRAGELLEAIRWILP
jgi:hypothetical protein